MKKIIYISIGFFFTLFMINWAVADLAGDPIFKPFGNATYFKDSTDYITVNDGWYVRDSIKAGAWIFAGANKQGGYYFDTTRKGEISFTGQSMYLYNRKENGYIYFYGGEKLSGFSFNKFSGGATSEIASIDTVYGLKLYSGNIQIDQAENPTGQIKLPSDTVSDYDANDAVTLNRQSGIITTKSLTTAVNAEYSFTLTNSLIVSTSKVFCEIRTGSLSQGTPIIRAANPGTGSATIVFRNIDPTNAINGTVIFSYVIFN